MCKVIFDLPMLDVMRIMRNEKRWVIRAFYIIDPSTKLDRVIVYYV